MSFLSFPLKTIFPELTTERPGFVSRKEAQPIVSQSFTRVVIIGPDIEGDNALVGEFGHVVFFNSDPCPPECAVVETRQGPYSPCYRTFHENSLCRSFPEPLEWDGELYR